MAEDAGVVETAGAARDRYHHGDLHAALIKATEEIIAERGVEGFSLREAARRAGVSAAAPAHHFGDARGLLTAVAVRGLNDLADVSRIASDKAGPDREAKRVAIGEAYIRYALDHRARFDLMFRKTLLDRDTPALHDAGERCFAVLMEAIGGDPHADPKSEARAIAAWSLVHGLARLKLDGMLLEEGDPDFVPMVLKTLSI